MYNVQLPTIYMHQVILPDLLTAPPHIPAQPLHLLQLHDREEKRNNPQSFLSLLSTAWLLISPWSFGPFQIQCDKPSVQLLFSCSSVWNQRSVSVAHHDAVTKPTFCTSLIFFPTKVLSFIWVLKVYGPWFSMRFDLLLALRIIS